MSRICPNCRKENNDESINCIKCHSPLDIDSFIKSKEFKKDSISKMVNVIGESKEDEINREISDFIHLYQEFNDYDNEFKSLKSSKVDLEKSKQFKNKYQQSINKLNQLKYINIIKGDKDLKRMYLELNDIKFSFNDFDKKIEDFNTLLESTLKKVDDIDKFEKDMDELLNSNQYIDTERKNKIIYDHKLTYDYFDRDEISDLPLGEKQSKVNYLLETYENLNELVEKHNKEFKEKEFINSLKRYEIVIDKFNAELDDLKESSDYLDASIKNKIKEKYKLPYDYLYENLYTVSIDYKLNNKINDFLNSYINLDNFIKNINNNITLKRKEEELNKNLSKVEEFNRELEELLNSPFYITWKDEEDLKSKYEDTYNNVYQGKSQDKINVKPEFNKFIDDFNLLKSTIEIRNEEFVERELNENADLFDDIENFNLSKKEQEDPGRTKKSLDNKQRRAVVINELSNQIVAGAGCGKTLTVLGKVRYLTERKGINPNHILCLSYSNKSVNDLKEKLPDGIYTYTFHGLGRSILLANDRPARADDQALNNFIKLYFKENVIDNEKLCEKIIEFYAYYLYNPIDEDEASSLGELYDMEEGRDFKTLRELYGKDKEKVTLKNEAVKSLEELIISNYYFMHQIDYQYETVYKVFNKNYDEQKDFISNLTFNITSKESYEKKLERIINKIKIRDFSDLLKEDLPINIGKAPYLNEFSENIMEFLGIKKSESDKEYLPDFYLPDYDIYHEHFGVNKDCEAKFLDGEEAEKYKEGIKWKRNLHKEKGTNLIETYSYYMRENRLLQRLEEKLKDEGVEIKSIDYGYLVSKIAERDEVNKFKDFMKLITGFIELFKGNNFTVDKFDDFRFENKSETNEFTKKRNELFLDITEDVFISYENYLKANEIIDFNDMINHATALVKEGKLNNKYHYIIVDEYQDTSHTRYQLLKAIQDAVSAKVCVVGDDWQSIYRFTGCDVSLFNNFEDYFKNPELLTIDTTYRNSQELIDVSGKFVKKNPNQIQKSLKSKLNEIKEIKDTKPVKITYYNKKSDEEKIKIFEYIVNKIAKDSNKILVLGRNKFDIKSYLKKDNESSPFIGKGQDNEEIIYEKNKDLKIRYITVHGSKGLEEDNVILINLENKISGFPNQKVDDPILNFVISDTDQFEYGEERRLFYVALTRTKNNVYILAPDTESDKSVFVKELEEDIDKLEVIDKTEIFPDEEEISENPEDFMKDKKVYSIKTKLTCPICKNGEISLIVLNKGSGKNLLKFFSCSHDRCEWEGGFYNSEIEFLDEIEICPDCGSILQPMDGRYGPYLKCTNKLCKHSENMKGEKLERFNKILDKINENAPKEIIKSELKCPECGHGNIVLEINKEDDTKRYFKCSDDLCSWNGGKTTITIGEFKDVEMCPDCDGLLVPRKSKNGNYFKGCTNFPKCRKTKEMENKEETKSIYYSGKNPFIETSLKCPKCGENVIVEIDDKNDSKFFKCLNISCKWNGGKFNQDIKYLDYIENCTDCDGVLYPRSGKKGLFMGCSNFPKCRKTKQFNEKNKKVTVKERTETKSKPDYNKKSSFTSKKSSLSNENNVQKIKTKIRCPECNNGTVILKRNKKTGIGEFKCTNCSYDGGSFNQTLDKLDSLEYCTAPGCNGLTYMSKGRFGEFRTCSNYFKTKCDANRSSKKKSNLNASKSNYSNSSNSYNKRSTSSGSNYSKSSKKSSGKYEATETKLDCPLCGNGKVTLMKNKETGKGFFKCSNDSCNYNGGPFNQDIKLLKTLDYCPVPSCDGLTYIKNTKNGPFKICTYFVKTKCNAGRK